MQSRSPEVTTLAELVALLSPGSEDAILAEICDGVFDGVIKGLKATAGCSHGVGKHLEGDVAEHTAKVVSILVKVSREDPRAEFDSIDLLAALMHDVEKTTTRVEDSQGNVTFVGHEEKAAKRIPEIARKLYLSGDQTEKLYFLVLEHGIAHSLPTADSAVQDRLISSRYWRNLRLLQKADAMSIYLSVDGSQHRPVHWDLFEELRRKSPRGF